MFVKCDFGIAPGVSKARSSFSFMFDVDEGSFMPMDVVGPTDPQKYGMDGSCLVWGAR